MSGWSAYTQLAIKAGAEKAGIFGRLDGGTWIPDPTITIKEWKDLSKDIEAGVNTSHMVFNGTKFMNTVISDDPRDPKSVKNWVGKSGEYACIMSRTAKTVTVVISKGTPQMALGHAQYLTSALVKASF